MQIYKSWCKFIYKSWCRFINHDANLYKSECRFINQDDKSRCKFINHHAFIHQDANLYIRMQIYKYVPWIVKECNFEKQTALDLVFNEQQIFVRRCVIWYYHVFCCDLVALLPHMHVVAYPTTMILLTVHVATLHILHMTYLRYNVE